MYFFLANLSFVSACYSSIITTKMRVDLYQRRPSPLLAAFCRLNGFMKALQDLLELTPKKDVLFIIGDWDEKVGRQETPGVTGKFGLGMRNEAGQRLIEFCQENALVIASTLFQQHKRRLYTWTSPDGQH